MELMNTFLVAGPVDRAWAALTDLERVAPCLPGATLLGIDGEDHRGAVEVTIGPVAARYEGVARFAERDDDEHHAVLHAEGRDVHGEGEARASVDVRLAARGDGTEVVVAADLELTGRMARFGSGVIAEVGGKLAGRFAQRLEEELDREPVGVTPRPLMSTTTSAEAVAPIDSMTTAAPAPADRFSRRALPLGTAAIGLVLGWLVGRAGRCGLGDGRPPVDRIGASADGAA